MERLASRILDDKLLLQQTKYGEETPIHGRLFTSGTGLVDNRGIHSFAEFSDVELSALRAMAKTYPNLDSAAGELAFQHSLLSRPPGNVHVISDLHGAANKLKFVLANASGTLRPFVEKCLSERDVSPPDITMTLYFIFNPSAFVENYRSALFDENSFFLENILIKAIIVLHQITKPYCLSHVRSLLPRAWSKLLREMIYSPASVYDSKIFCDSKTSFISRIAHSIRSSNRLSKFMGMVSSLIRSLSVEELLVNGDLWDRGPRGDQESICSQEKNALQLL